MRLSKRGGLSDSSPTTGCDQVSQSWRVPTGQPLSRRSSNRGFGSRRVLIKRLPSEFFARELWRSETHVRVRIIDRRLCRSCARTATGATEAGPSRPLQVFPASSTISLCERVSLEHGGRSPSNFDEAQGRSGHIHQGNADVADAELVAPYSRNIQKPNRIGGGWRYAAISVGIPLPILPNPARNDVPDLVEPWQRPPRRAAPSPPSECGGILLIL